MSTDTSTSAVASTNAGAVAPLHAEFGRPLEQSLEHIVANSQNHLLGEKDELAPSEQRADAVHAHGAQAKKWISHLWPSAESLDRLFTHEHMGNFVIDRQTGRKIFESMPLYVRVGMHLLFVSGSGYMTYPSIEKLLEVQSIKQGKLYDMPGPEVRQHIESFIKTYDLPVDELLVADLDQYPTFNSFFSRRLKPTARPITSPADSTVVISPADCRLTAFQTVDQAKTFWRVHQIKGQQFNIPTLLVGSDAADTRFKAVQDDPQCSILISRLAPQDYHRFHVPFDGVVVDIKDIKGELYTVNPQAINEDLNVFTLNKRSIMLIHANLGPGKEAVPVAFVAVGAMLVGSIGWSKKPGDKLAKGEELGWFQYGGSTCILVCPSAAGVVFDQDIVANSEKQTETLVRVGMEVGKIKQ